MQWLQVMKQAKMAPSVECYTAVIDAYGENAFGDGGINSERASQLVDQMLNSGLVLNTQAYNVALRTKAKAAEPNVVEALLDRMEAKHVIPDESSYASVIRTYVEAGDAAGAESWLAKMRGRGAQPGEAAYAGVLRAWADVGSDRGIRRCLAAMSDDGVELSTRCYNAVISAFCRKGDTQSAADLVEVMTEKGCEPDKYTYTAMIQALAKSGNVGEAQHWIQQMKERGVAPDAFIYTLLAGAFAKQGRHGDVEKIMQIMRAKGEEPTAATWTWLIVSTGVDMGRSTTKNTPEAVFRDMVAAGVAPTMFTTNALDRQLPGGVAQRQKLFKELGVVDPKVDDPYAATTGQAATARLVNRRQKERSEVKAKLRSATRRGTMKAKTEAVRLMMLDLDRTEPIKKGRGRHWRPVTTSGVNRGSRKTRRVPRTPTEQRDGSHGVGGFIRECNSEEPMCPSTQGQTPWELPTPWAGARK